MAADSVGSSPRVSWPRPPRLSRQMFTFGPPEGIDGLSPLLGPLGVVDLHRSPEDLPGVGSLRLFAGYAGWSAGQLDAELMAGGWFVVDAFPEDAVVEEPTELWRMVLGRQPGLLGHLDGYPDNPSMN